MLGQEAANIAKSFKEAAPVSGVILARLTVTNWAVLPCRWLMFLGSHIIYGYWGAYKRL